MIEQSFTENGIVCEMHRYSEREHEIICYPENRPREKLSEKYTCQYPALFGRDVYDNNELERIVDELLQKIQE